MTSKILFEIQHFSIEGKAQISHPHFTISNDNNIRDAFYTDVVISKYGNYSKVYNRNDAFIYAEIHTDITNKSNEDILREISEKSSVLSHYVSTFLLFLWLTKDNSICINNSLLITPENESFTIRSNIKFLTYTSKGTFDQTIYSKPEMEYAIWIYEKHGKLLLDANKNKTPYQPEIEMHRNEDGQVIYATENRISRAKYSSYNCIDRGLHFLNVARRERHPAFKISFYVPILESIFTTDSFAVTHKVCERVSIYLEEEKEKRKELYNFLNDVYAIRSKFLHGQKFPESDLDKIMNGDDAERLGEIVRACLIMVMIYDYNLFTELKTKGNSTKKTIERRDEFLKYLMFSQ